LHLVGYLYDHHEHKIHFMLLAETCTSTLLAV